MSTQLWREIKMQICFLRRNCPVIISNSSSVFLFLCCTSVLQRTVFFLPRRKTSIYMSVETANASPADHPAKFGAFSSAIYGGNERVLSMWSCVTWAELATYAHSSLKQKYRHLCWKKRLREKMKHWYKFFIKSSNVLKASKSKANRVTLPSHLNRL